MTFGPKPPPPYDWPKKGQVCVLVWVDSRYTLFPIGYMYEAREDYDPRTSAQGIGFVSRLATPDEEAVWRLSGGGTKP